MNLLKQLGFSCWWISNHADVNIRSESSSSQTFEILFRSTKKLCQQSLLDFLMAINRRSKAPDKVIDGSWRIGHLSEFILIVIVVNHFKNIFVKDFHGFFFDSSKWNHVQVSREDWAYDTLVFPNFRLIESVNAHNLNSIAGSYSINIGTVGNYCNRTWSLTFWNELRKFLKLDKLFINEAAWVMNNFECFFHFAPFAYFRLVNSCIVKSHMNFSLTIAAHEYRTCHFRVNFWASDDNSSHGDHSVDLCMIEISQRSYLIKSLYDCR